MNSADIILTTANARYTHTAFGLKRLWQSSGRLQEQTRIVEFTVRDNPHEIARTLLALNPRIIGFGVYIWNVDLLSHVVCIIRAVAPDILIVLGGPEMVNATAPPPIAGQADYVITGEGEEAFPTLAALLLAGERPAEKMIVSPPPSLETLPDPYPAYTDEDLHLRVLYVESSRGCPYRCAFCLSALERRVRCFPLAPFLQSMDTLLNRGARRFKFTDRTFNLHEERVQAILDFFLQRVPPDLQLHFEIMPDKVSASVLEKMACFPANALHLEIGIQSVSPTTQRMIGRGQDIKKSIETIRALRRNTGALLHADLIVGLPGDTASDVARGFDMLVEVGVQEIQVGLLKRLRGAPITGVLGQDSVFDPHAPYEVLQTPAFSYAEIQRFKRFARYCDLYYNNGNFPATMPLLWETADTPFAAFSALCDWLWAREQRTHKLPLARLAERLYQFLAAQNRHDPERLAQTVEKDFRRLKGRRDKLRLGEG